ncbi:hypothetical protein AAMO2058_001033700 [Amorphochlora amoebiformis]
MSLDHAHPNLDSAHVPKNSERLETEADESSLSVQAPFDQTFSGTLGHTQKDLAKRLQEIRSKSGGFHQVDQYHLAIAQLGVVDAGAKAALLELQRDMRESVKKKEKGSGRGSVGGNTTGYSAAEGGKLERKEEMSWGSGQGKWDNGSVDSFESRNSKGPDGAVSSTRHRSNHYSQNANPNSNANCNSKHRSDRKRVSRREKPTEIGDYPHSTHPDQIHPSNRHHQGLLKQTWDRQQALEASSGFGLPPSTNDFTSGSYFPSPVSTTPSQPRRGFRLGMAVGEGVGQSSGSDEMLSTRDFSARGASTRDFASNHKPTSQPYPYPRNATQHTLHRPMLADSPPRERLQDNVFGTLSTVDFTVSGSNSETSRSGTRSGGLLSTLNEGIRDNDAQYNGVSQQGRQSKKESGRCTDRDANYVKSSQVSNLSDSTSYQVDSMEVAGNQFIDYNAGPPFPRIAPPPYPRRSMEETLSEGYHLKPSKPLSIEVVRKSSPPIHAQPHFPSNPAPYVLESFKLSSPDSLLLSHSPITPKSTGNLSAKGLGGGIEGLQKAESEDSLILLPCRNCGRRFNKRSLPKHQRVCSSVFTKRRPKLSGREMRAKRTQISSPSGSQASMISDGASRLSGRRSPIPSGRRSPVTSVMGMPSSERRSPPNSGGRRSPPSSGRFSGRSAGSGTISGAGRARRSGSFSSKRRSPLASGGSSMVSTGRRSAPTSSRTTMSDSPGNAVPQRSRSSLTVGLDHMSGRKTRSARGHCDRQNSFDGAVCSVCKAPQRTSDRCRTCGSSFKIHKPIPRRYNRVRASAIASSYGRRPSGSQSDRHGYSSIRHHNRKGLSSTATTGEREPIGIIQRAQLHHHPVTAKDRVLGWRAANKAMRLKSGERITTVGKRR